jgi:large subunit ribosomal protein L25
VRVSLPAAEVRAALRAHGRRGLAARLFDVRVRDRAAGLDVTHRVLPRQVHVGGVSGAVENVNFIACPPGRRVAVRVPVRVLGDAVAPGVKRGGFLNLIRRDVRVVCDGGRVPASVDVDASRLDLGDRVPLASLALPYGVALDEKHADLPVLKIAGRQARE